MKTLTTRLTTMVATTVKKRRWRSLEEDLDIEDVKWGRVVLVVVTVAASLL